MKIKNHLALGATALTTLLLLGNQSVARITGNTEPAHHNNQAQWDFLQIKEDPNFIFIRTHAHSPNHNLLSLLKTNVGALKLALSLPQQVQPWPLGRQPKFEQLADSACLQVKTMALQKISIMKLAPSVLVGKSIRDRIRQRFAFTAVRNPETDDLGFTLTAAMIDCRDPSGARLAITQVLGGEHYIPLLFSHGNQATYRYAEMKEDGIEEAWPQESRMEERQRIDAEMIRMQVYIGETTAALTRAYLQQLNKKIVKVSLTRILNPQQIQSVFQQAMEIKKLFSRAGLERRSTYRELSQKYPDTYPPYPVRHSQAHAEDPLRELVKLLPKRTIASMNQQ